MFEEKSCKMCMAVKITDTRLFMHAILNPTCDTTKDGSVSVERSNQFWRVVVGVSLSCLLICRLITTIAAEFSPNNYNYLPLFDRLAHEKLRSASGVRAQSNAMKFQKQHWCGTFNCWCTLVCWCTLTVIPGNIPYSTHGRINKLHVRRTEKWGWLEVFAGTANNGSAYLTRKRNIPILWWQRCVEAGKDRYTAPIHCRRGKRQEQ